MQMRVLFVVQSFSGGVGTSALNIADTLRRKYSICVHIHEIVRIEPLYKRLPHDVSITYGFTEWHFNKFHYLPLHIAGLAKVIKRFRPDVIISCWPHTHIASFFAMKVANVNTKWIACEHGDPNLYIRGRAAKKILLQLVCNADKHVAVSQYVAGLVEKTYCRKDCIVIPDPVDVKAIERLSREKVTHRWFTGNNKVVIIGVGRLVRVKRFDTLIRTFFLVRNFIPESRLVIVGDGEEKENLIQLSKKLGIKGHVEFTGYLPNPYPYIRGAHVLVSTSLSEGFGYTVAEAAILGTPVVAYRGIGAFSEMAEMCSSVMVVDNIGIGSLAMAIMDAVNVKSQKGPCNHIKLWLSKDNVCREYFNLLADTVGRDF